MKKALLWGGGIIALVFAFYLGTGYQEQKDLASMVGIPDAGEEIEEALEEGELVTYECDNGRVITAQYYTAATVEPVLGEAPMPTGWVQLSLDGAPSLRLNQTVSADGVRYVNPDESLTFWSKGDEALVLKNNSLDLAYTNCEAED